MKAVRWHVTSRWNRCDQCGRFIAMSDFNDGTAKRVMITADTAFTCESYETLCKVCNKSGTEKKEAEGNE